MGAPFRWAGPAVRPAHTLAPLEGQPSSAGATGSADGDLGMDATPTEQQRQEQEAAEAPPAKTLPGPPQPTAQMIADHRASGLRQGCLQHSPECRARIEQAVPNDPVDSEWYFRAVERQEGKRAKVIGSPTVATDSTAAPTSSDTGVSNASAAGARQAAGTVSAPAASSSSGVIGAASSSSGIGVPDRAAQAQTTGGQTSQSTAPPPNLKRDRPEESDEEMPAMYDLYDPDEEIDEFIMNLHETYVATVQEQVRNGMQHPVCEVRNPFDDFDPNWWSAYDDVNGGPLDPLEVKKARLKEIDVINEVELWSIMPRKDMPKGAKTISGRWVDTNKGDADKPNYRSRYVGRELKRLKHQSAIENLSQFFAAMPPLSALKLILCLAVTTYVPDLQGNMRKQQTKCIALVDIKRAHFWAIATRELYAELPEECGYDVREYVGKVLRGWYGTQDASRNWELEIRRVMVDVLGFVQGRSNPCLYWHQGKDIQVEVHGDDFTALAVYETLQWFISGLKNHWMLEVRGILGPPETPGTIQEARVLNRIITWDNEGILWEADPRHADIIMQRTGVTNAVTTPLVKEKIEEVEDDNEIELDSGPAEDYRSVAMRGAYLSQDRPDLQRAGRELAKGLQRPTTRHQTQLKRLARYLRNSPRIAQRFKYQKNFSKLTGWSDTDHAGCIRTRKSTTGGTIQAGHNTLLKYCRGQSVIALGSGEAEYYGLVSIASKLLGMRSVCLDFGMLVGIEAFLDATTGIAIGSRRGLGKVKHIDTVFLWVQDLVNDGKLKVSKKHTSEMLADFLTKPTTEATIKKCMKGLGYVPLEGRHAIAYGRTA